MHRSAIVVGLLTLFFPPLVHALQAPPLAPTIAPYAKAVLDQADQRLQNATSGGPQTPCTPGKNQAEVARSLAVVLLNVEAVREAGQDLQRATCLRHDAEALERYIRALIDLAMQSASACDDAASRYSEEVQRVWSHLMHLRRYGLDPRTQAPIGGPPVEEIPDDATAASDDELCPYAQVYADPAFGGLGCNLPTAASQRLQDEAGFINQVIQRMDIGSGLALELSRFQNALEKLWNATASFVTSVSVQKMPGPPVFTPLTFTPAIPTNVGESGCLGWPSVAGGVVTGTDVPLQHYFPLVLTRELAEVIAFVRDQGAQPGFMYITVPTGDNFSYRTDLGADSLHHLRIELSTLLSHIDPARRMALIASRLHEQTRGFVSLAVPLEGSAVMGEPPLPPLRNFTRRYAAFLAGMCANRGCGSTLQRAVELSLRDECFQSFLMDTFFQDNPSASTLPSCRSLYVP